MLLFPPMPRPARAALPALALALCLALPWQASVAADTVGAAADFMLGTSTPNTRYADLRAPDTSPLDLHGSAMDASGNSITYRDYAGQDPSPHSFGTYAAGTGTFDVATEMNFRSIYTNTSSVDELVVAGVQVDGGHLDVDCRGAARCDGSASYSFNARVDGITAAWGSARLGLDSGGAVLQVEGTALANASGTGVAAPLPGQAGNAVKTASYRWDPTLLDVSLGVVRPGQNVVFDYHMFTRATGGYNGPLGAPGGPGTDCGGVVCTALGDPAFTGGTTGTPAAGSSRAYTGDPTGAGIGTTAPLLLFSATPVPEPEWPALALAGAAALWLARRRRA